MAKLSFSPYLPNSPVSPTFMGPFIALCFALLANVAKLSFSPYLPNSPVSPIFMGPPYCFVLCLVGDSGKIVIFAIFAKFASIANLYGPPHCFVLWHVGDCGKIVIFAIFGKFAIMFSCLPFLLLRAFLDISPIRPKQYCLQLDIALWCKNQIEHSTWDESLLLCNCTCSLECSSLSTLAGLSYHICVFKASPSSQHQHCTDEAQRRPYF